MHKEHLVYYPSVHTIQIYSEGTKYIRHPRQPLHVSVFQNSAYKQSTARDQSCCTKADLSVWR